MRERDRVRATLLSSIGQDIRPRLTAIGGAVRALKRARHGRQGAAVDHRRAKPRSSTAISPTCVDLGPESDQQPVEAGGVTIDLFQRAVSKDGREVHLTPKEYAVLAELAKHPGRVLTHAHLLRTAWGPAQRTQTEYLRVAIRALRQKLERDPARPEIIVNEPAVGYRLIAG